MGGIGTVVGIGLQLPGQDASVLCYQAPAFSLDGMAGTGTRRSFILSLLFGIWAWFAETTGLVTWAGAAGCTTYFACCGCGQDAQKGIWSNLSGIFWASLSLWLTDQNVNPYLLMTIFTFIMCIQSIHPRGQD